MSKKVKCGKHCFVFSFSVLLFSVVIFRRVFKNPSRITHRGQAAINLLNFEIFMRYRINRVKNKRIYDVGEQ